MTASAGVLIVDDDDLVRAGLRVVIDAEPDLRVVAECADGLEVAALVRQHRPDVVLMDVRMPGIDGIATIRHLLATHDEPPKVLVLTTFGTDTVVHDALRVGASGFLVKRARVPEIVQAIRTVGRGESLVFPATIRAMAPRPGAPPPRTEPRRPVSPSVNSTSSSSSPTADPTPRSGRLSGSASRP